MKFIDMAGQVFGKLTVLKREGSTNAGQAKWLCQCECGNTCIAAGQNLRNNSYKSCGCLKVERAREMTALYHGRDLPNGIAARNRMFNRYKGQASFRKLPFELTIEQFEKLTRGNCHYCGIEPSTPYASTGGISPNGHYFANGIDRIENKKGYVLDNCVSCCRTCNYAKRGMNYENFRSWTRRFNRDIDYKRVSGNVLLD